MPKSQTDLCNRALRKLQQVGTGQSARASDLETALNYLGPLTAELASLEVCSVFLSDDTDALEIDDEIFEGLATMLALDLAPEFGQPAASDATRLAGMAALRRITAARPTYEPLAVNYF